MENETKELIVRSETSLFFNQKKFEHAKNVATIFAESDMVPAHFKGKVGNCIIALNLAERFKADPFMVMQNIYIVHGKPGIEGKLVIALVNSTGKFTALQFNLDGTGDKATCFAFATMNKTGEQCNGPTASIAMAKAEGWYGKQGSKWKTMPGLMLRYRAAAFFARTFCPEALLGMQTKEELFDIVDVVPAKDGTFVMPPEQKSADELTETLKKPDITDPKGLDLKDIEPPQAVKDKEFRKEWINLKKGFPQYMLDNLDRFKQAIEPLRKEALDKWMRLVAKGVIGDIPWPLAEEAEEIRPEHIEPGPDDVEKTKNWDAYKYLFGDVDFENFRAAYENLGEEVYQNALKQLGWTAVATSEECRQIADLMSVMDESIEEKF